MPRFYADEDFDYPSVVELRALGYDVLTVAEAGKAGDDDPEVLAHAVRLQRSVLTHNRRHFIRLHRQQPVHFGIVVCTRDKNWRALAKRIEVAVSGHPTLDNLLLRVNRPAKP